MTASYFKRSDDLDDIAVGKPVLLQIKKTAEHFDFLHIYCIIIYRI